MRSSSNRLMLIVIIILALQARSHKMQLRLVALLTIIDSIKVIMSNTEKSLFVIFLRISRSRRLQWTCDF